MRELLSYVRTQTRSALRNGNGLSSYDVSLLQSIVLLVEIHSTQFSEGPEGG